MDPCQFEQMEAQVVSYFKLAGYPSTAYIAKGQEAAESAWERKCQHQDYDHKMN